LRRKFVRGISVVPPWTVASLWILQANFDSEVS
jgi:hypothetical protein